MLSATNGKQLVMDLFCEIDLSGDGRVSLRVSTPPCEPSGCSCRSCRLQSSFGCSMLIGAATSSSGSSGIRVAHDTFRFALIQLY